MDIAYKSLQSDADVLLACQRALTQAQRLSLACLRGMRALLAAAEGGAPDALNVHQASLHGCAWLATYVRALEETLAWGNRLADRQRLVELDRALLLAAYGEYLSQLSGGLTMSQGEIFRVSSLVHELQGAAPAAADQLAQALQQFRADDSVQQLMATGFDRAARQRIATLLRAGAATREFGDIGFADSELVEIRSQFARYADDHAAAAHRWHLDDALIPDDVVAELAQLGVFALTIAPEFGGLGMGKTSMCVVTEELSRGFIGLGSLGTRSEIAAELIGAHGTAAQKAELLPAIAAGTILPAAAFTEPDFGSDLASLRTRAERGNGEYRISGNKTWTTHGARSDLLTLMVRTQADQPGFRGLSMLMVRKPRGTDAMPFPAAGMAGTEIKVLGYRGMKEYEIAFDGFVVPDTALLGTEEGQGFKQLMATFESARIQTAARAVGVAQCAMELALQYAMSRVQFGKSLLEFPRVGDKIAWMGVETMVARQLCHYAARRKDAGARCDLEAGMAKLLAARVAWTNADNAVQVHGGNGYAQEFTISRVLCDARILSIFEGAAEIQAQVIGRALLAETAA